MADQNLFKEVHGDNKKSHSDNIKYNLVIAIVQTARQKAISQKVLIDDVFTKLGISDELSENIKMFNLPALSIDVLVDVLYSLGYRASLELSQQDLEDNVEAVIKLKMRD
ncbi:hypothetical protein KEN51_CDS0199 [Pseudomonas phage vB_Pae10145-KEN51]|uniref:PHIKZ187 n=6 Tax=Viruses TaxID=10239 RepID=Q8SCX5_BPDPK|nr:hypothetical protein [Pseudomonas aeruginosa]NP_803753.1 PHIKZ187 [Pseudomonas phage phiKZ]YP_009617468.1 hypothetical protein FDI90_gp180 [Pseudomonas phage PA7]YP_009619691.1 hypothetical protein FDJ06_gp151 [Pseudomonas phage SL2]ANM44986.1 hypothetical protein KTN4_228 [Pseudomonas phage KTN4]QJB22864.1 hypothetical protein fnug_221 [Pseudomonas phage fnug]USL86806.1 hypothetical protein CDGHABPJ_00348 [Pseudomonas phage OMKO1]WAX23401.1 hypothetical protein [Pseudomonas phage pPA-N18